MKKHLTRFVPLSRTPERQTSDDSRRCPAFARVQRHVEELRRFFDLPDDEIFLDEFYCALSKRILLQGRMYIFEHYLCFYSNLFGWVKQKVIPLESIQEITKKRNCGIHNSIEVVWDKREFFTSLLNRNDAYELLQDAVRNVQETEQRNVGDTESKHLASTSSGYSTEAAPRRINYPSSKRRSKDGSSDVGDYDSDADVNSSDSGDVWKIIPESAPAVPENMELLSTDKLAVSVQEFFARTLAMDSVFLDNYHKERGDKRYRLSSWEELPEIIGAVRQAAFISPVKGVGRIGFIAPKTTECNQDHRLCIYQGDHMVFQISQVMKDIPYGDNFSVEIRWDVKPIDDGNSCEITIHVAVIFIRSVLAPFRSMIESNVMKEMQQSVKLMTEMLTEVVSISAEIAETEVGIGIDPSDHEESTSPIVTAQMSAKLQSLLADEGNVQILEHLIGSSEIGRQKRPLEPTPHSIPSPKLQIPPMSVNWVLFCCCIFMLFCQIMLVVIWLASPPWRQPYPALDRYTDSPVIDQMRQLEETLLSFARILNSTLDKLEYGSQWKGCHN